VDIDHEAVVAVVAVFAAVVVVVEVDNQL